MLQTLEVTRWVLIAIAGSLIVYSTGSDLLNRRTRPASEINLTLILAVALFLYARQ